MIVLIDNYDSFTHNLAQYIGTFTEVLIKRNDDLDLEIAIKKSDGIILSPGPGEPKDAGFMEEMIKKFYNKKPILGICLGHQAIGEVFGANIKIAKYVWHGKMSQTQQTFPSRLFDRIKEEFTVMRYHSLVIEENSLNKDFMVTSRSKEDNEIMSIEHRNLPIFGLQFHPESIGTPDGMKMIENFINIVKTKKQ